MQNCAAREGRPFLICFVFVFVFTVSLRIWTGSLTVNKKVCGFCALLLKGIYNAYIAQHLTMWTHFFFSIVTNSPIWERKARVDGSIYILPRVSKFLRPTTGWAHILCSLITIHLWIPGPLLLQIWKWWCELCGAPTLFNSAAKSNNGSKLWGAPWNLQWWFLFYANLLTFHFSWLQIFPLNVYMCLVPTAARGWCWLSRNCGYSSCEQMNRFFQLYPGHV